MPKIILNPSLIYQKMKDDSFRLTKIDLMDDDYWEIDGIKADVWDLMTKKVPLKKIIQTISEQNDLPMDEVKEHVDTFVRELLEEDLIRLSEE